MYEIRQNVWSLPQVNLLHLNVSKIHFCITLQFLHFGDDSHGPISSHLLPPKQPLLATITIKTENCHSLDTFDCILYSAWSAFQENWKSRCEYMFSVNWIPKGKLQVVYRYLSILKIVLWGLWVLITSSLIRWLGSTNTCQLVCFIQFHSSFVCLKLLLRQDLHQNPAKFAGQKTNVAFKKHQKSIVWKPGFYYAT